MPAHSASKTRVNALMSRASTSCFVSVAKDVDGRDKPGHDVESVSIIATVGIRGDSNSSRLRLRPAELHDRKIIAINNDLVTRLSEKCRDVATGATKASHRHRRSLDRFSRRHERERRVVAEKKVRTA